MKCDEVRPVCGPCAKGDRPCVYGALPAGCRLESEAGNDHPASTPVHQQLDTVSPESPSREEPQQWLATAPPDDILQTTSLESSYSTSTVYGTELAPLRWFGLLAGDATDATIETPSGPTTVYHHRKHADNLASRELTGIGSTSTAFPEGMAPENPSNLPHPSAILPSPSSAIDERHYWQSLEPIQLKDHEHDMFQRFVTGVSLWIDLFDPLRHISTFVPHLALHNEGLMKAVLALGARHLSIKPLKTGEANIDRTAAVQYYYETLQCLQSAMRFTSYKNSLELLATALVVSTYEMIDGAGKGWERHLKGAFWIQRSRNLNGESGGIEQAIWWAWLRQDMWAAFRERRRCFSFFQPTKPYELMDIWDMASRVVYLLVQSVNYSSEEEKQIGESDLVSRILRANTLLGMLDEWRSSISIHFETLPVEGPYKRAFKPLWIHPSPLGTSMQMFCMARILLLIHQPAAGGYLEYLGRDKVITECIDTISGIAMKLMDDASRLLSTQTLFAAGLYCTDSAKRDCIAELIDECQMHTGWPSNTSLADELRTEWARQAMQKAC